MAFTPLSTNTTLAKFRSGILTRLGLLSEQQKGFMNVQLNNMIHDAIVLVRAKLVGSEADTLYDTDADVLEQNSKVDISGLDIFPNTRPSLCDDSYGKIDIISTDLFNGRMTLYQDELDDELFARISNSAMRSWPILDFSDYSGTIAGTVKAHSPSHGLTGVVAGVNIVATNKYTGTYTITYVDLNNFRFTHAYSGTELGSWTLSSSIKRQIIICRGSNKSPSGNLTLTYRRGVIKATANTDYIDLPDTYIPFAMDIAQIIVSRKIKKEIPEDVSMRAVALAPELKE